MAISDVSPSSRVPSRCVFCVLSSGSSCFCRIGDVYSRLCWMAAAKSPRVAPNVVHKKGGHDWAQKHPWPAGPEGPWPASQGPFWPLSASSFACTLPSLFLVHVRSEAHMKISPNMSFFLSFHNMHQNTRHTRKRGYFICQVAG